MKGIKTILGIALATTGFGGAIAVGAVSAETNRVEQTVAATTINVYYAVPSATVGSYSVKCNVQYGNQDGGNWGQHSMSKNGATIDGNPVYSCSFSINDSGLNTMQIQLYSGADWQSQEVAFSSWTTTGTFNGKVWIHGSGWATYNPDPEYMSVIGSFTGSNWATDFDMTLNLSGHKATYTGLSLIKNDTFKIRKNHDYSKGEWGSSNLGSSSFMTECFGSDGSNIKALHDGTYNIELNYSTHVITITGERAPQDSEDIHVVHLYTASTDSWNDQSVSLKAGSSTEYTGQFTFGIGDKFIFNIANTWYGYQQIKAHNELKGEHNYFYEDNDHNVLVNVAGTYTLYMETASGDNFGIWLQKDSVDGIANSKEFAKQFNSAISGVCDLSGKTTDVSALNTEWTNQATKFGQQVAEVQSYLKSATSSDGDSDIASFIAKYTSVYTLRGKSLTSGDFLVKGITPRGTNAISPISTASNSAATIVIMIACLAVSATGVFIILKKKKHN